MDAKQHDQARREAAEALDKAIVLMREVSQYENTHYTASVSTQTGMALLELLSARKHLAEARTNSNNARYQL